MASDTRQWTSGHAFSRQQKPPTRLFNHKIWRLVPRVNGRLPNKTFSLLQNLNKDGEETRLDRCTGQVHQFLNHAFCRVHQKKLTKREFNDHRLLDSREERTRTWLKTLPFPSTWPSPSTNLNASQRRKHFSWRNLHVERVEERQR